MSDIFVANNERCQIAELDEIAMILMGISDNMFSGPSVSVSSSLQIKSQAEICEL